MVKDLPAVATGWKYKQLLSLIILSSKHRSNPYHKHTQQTLSAELILSPLWTGEKLGQHDLFNTPAINNALIKIQKHGWIKGIVLLNYIIIVL